MRTDKFICTALMVSIYMAVSMTSVYVWRNKFSHGLPRQTSDGHSSTFSSTFSWTFMDFTSEQNAEVSNYQTNTNDKLFDVSGEALALAELVGNQV